MMKLWLELALVLLVVIDRQSPYILFTNVLRVCVCVFIIVIAYAAPQSRMSTGKWRKSQRRDI